jgi:hypothetical protein
MRVWLPAAATVILALATSARFTGSTPAPLEYELTWTAFARQSSWRDHDIQPVAAGERSGRASARLVRVSPGVLRLEWHGPEGGGQGLIGPAGPTNVQFPSPLPITGPPAMPHLSGGTFEYSGDPERPDAFTISYVEGFICRSTPAVCDGVAMWERRFEARGRRR